MSKRLLNYIVIDIQMIEKCWGACTCTLWRLLMEIKYSKDIKSSIRMRVPLT